jgi:hypothetical protein
MQACVRTCVRACVRVCIRVRERLCYTHTHKHTHLMICVHARVSRDSSEECVCVGPRVYMCVCMPAFVCLSVCLFASPPSTRVPAPRRRKKKRENFRILKKCPALAWSPKNRFEHEYKIIIRDGFTHAWAGAAQIASEDPGDP